MAAPFHSRSAALAIVLLSGVAASAIGAPLDLTLSFGTLPSSQGFTYVASGADAGVAEPGVFSVDGTQLTQNTLGRALGTTGAGLFYQRLNGITTTESKRIVVRARVLSEQVSPSTTVGNGSFVFGFATGSTQYLFGISSSRLHVLQGSAMTQLPGTYDNTQYHDYIYEWLPGGAWQLFRDGVLVASGSGGGALAANRILFGDGTGGANAHGQVSAFRFTQDLATGVTTRTWGRIKALYR